VDVTICVGTFGGPEWVHLAHTRAIPSAEAQGCDVVHRHAKTLATARNTALALSKTSRVIFLDADDELEPGYVEALEAGAADLRAPAVRYIKGGRERDPYVPQVAGHDHACAAECLRDGNWLVIGTSVRRDLALEVGGFREWPVYEDWDFFQRCWLAGATVEAIPEAIYRAHWRRDSRNRAPDMAVKNGTHHEIMAANFGEPAAAA
jgi:glycosyltransferase involved in cell wall biosynthesis